jgi:DNA-binding CsgD family transcriptional regulator
MAEADDPISAQWPFAGRDDDLGTMVAALTDQAVIGAVVHGRPGVGKTRLAEECLAVAQAGGWWCVRAVASERTQQVPLGAIAHLLPARILLERSDPVTLFPKVAATVKARGAGRRVVVLVDDLHLLDATSATLIGQLLDAGLNFLVGTVRTGERVPATVSALWRSDRIRRVDLDDLPAATIGTILEEWLGGTVAPDAIAAVWAASQGNVLFAREMVLGAFEAGRFRLDRGVWRLAGPLDATSRLRDAVRARLEVLDEGARAALDLVALWEPVGLAMLDAAIGAPTVEELERSSFIRVRTGDRRQAVTVAHPVYGEVLRRGLPATTRRRLLLDLVETIRGRGARRREDPVTLATAYLDATGTADSELLLSAAWLARFSGDYLQVERLSRFASIAGVTPEIGLLRGEALHELARYDEAGKVLAAALAVVPDDSPLFGPLVEMQVRNLMWGLRRPDEAMSVLKTMQQRARDESTRRELRAEEASVLSYTGRPLEGLASLRGIGDDVEGRTRVIAAVAAAPALLATARCEDALALTERSLEEHLRLGDHAGMPGPAIHLIFRIQALTDAGRMAESTALAEATYRQIPPRAPPGAVWFVVGLGRNALLTGKLLMARHWFREAIARSVDNPGPRRVVLSLLATTTAAMGDLDATQSAVTELEAIEPIPFLPGEQLLGPAWALAAAGSLATAREQLVASAGALRSSGHSLMEAWLLHDACRLGQRGTSARLAELAGSAQGALLPAWAAHATAIDKGDAAELSEVAETFRGLGTMLFAAETATEAAHAFRRAGDQRAAAGQLAQAGEFMAGCESPRTPALASTESPVPLTDRELEICLLAAEGASSPAIAAQLFLSVRTVNNHLQRAYTKLGVRNRAELGDALRLGNSAEHRVE